MTDALFEGLAYIRLSSMIFLISFLFILFRHKQCDPRPLIVSLIIYFGISLLNQTLARFEALGDVTKFIIGYGGIPLVLIVMLGTILTIKNSK